MDRSKWVYKKLGDIGEVITGGTPPTKDERNYSSDDYCFVKPSDLTDESVIMLDDSEFHVSSFAYSNARKLPKGSVLVCCIGSIGKMGILNVEATCNQQINAIIPNTEINSRYLAYSLLASKHNLLNIANAPVVPIINKSQFSNIKIKVFSPQDQQRIVAELDCLNEMIAVKQEQLKEFDKLAQSIFYDMFESVKELVQVSHYIESLSGGKSLAGETECINKVLKTGAVTYDYFREEEVKNLPLEYEPIVDHLLRDGDLLISRMNTLEYVGAIAYVWKAPQNTYLPDRLWRAKVRNNANPIYLWYSLKQDKAKEQIRAKASGTSGSMKNISMPKFLSTTIKNVPLALQQEFAEKIQAIEAQKELVKKSIAETQALLDYTMDKYFG